jgi:hypothetical protein
MGSITHIRNSDLLRNALAALVLSCSLLSVVGEYVAVKVVQWDIRQDVAAAIRAGISEDQLVFIKIETQNPPAGFVWLEDGEFRYQNSVYDVVRREIHGNFTYFYCLYDDRETEFYAKIEQRVADEMTQNPARKKQRNQLLEKIPKFYFVGSFFFSIFDIKFGESPTVSPVPHIAQFEPKPPSPPPDAA